MSKKTLLILAAGMGSRYGGLKQLDGLGPNGETIIDYSVYDAIQAGFDKLVFVIRPHFEEEFKSKVSSKYESLAEVVHVYQEVNSPIEGIDTFPEREKPWGTGHAVLVCESVIHEPFAVINADDYYGKEAFVQMADFLNNRISENKNSLIGYKLGNTLSENGHVSRGVCQVNDELQLVEVNERTKIAREDGTIYYHEGDQKYPLSEESYVSMNFWGFHPDLFPMFRKGFLDFVNYSRPTEKQEYFIPLVVDYLIKSGRSEFEVIPSNSTWIGVTYQEDRQPTVDKFAEMGGRGNYPEKLF